MIRTSNQEPHKGEVILIQGWPHVVLTSWRKITPGDANGKTVNVQTVGWGVGAKLDPVVSAKWIFIRFFGA